MANGLPPAPSDAALKSQATNEVTTDINTQVSPLEGDIASAQRNQQWATGELDKMFGELQPAVSESAQRLEAYDAASLNFERDIFGAASEQLNNLRQASAAQAQTMAQELGAPVSLSEFNYGADAVAAAESHQSRAALMHSLGYSVADVGEAEAFAGRVFPLIRTEQTKQTIAYFQKQINDTQREINTLRTSAAGRISQRYNELKAQNLQYQLDRWKALRDSEIAKEQLKISKQNAKNDAAQIAIQKAQTLGYFTKQYRDKNGKLTTVRIPTAAAKAANLDVAKFHEQQRVDTADIKAQEAATKNAERQTELAYKELGQKQAGEAGQILDVITHPQAGKTATVTRAVQIAPAEDAAGNPLNAPPGVKYDQVAKGPDGRLWYYKYVDVKVASSSHPIVDPNRAYHYLVGQGITGAVAAKAVRERFSLPDSWKPSEGNYKWSVAELKNLTFVDLRRIAVSKGFTPDPKNPRTAKWLRNYILNH